VPDAICVVEVESVVKPISMTVGYDARCGGGRERATRQRLAS
jgi:hypothetical protein